MTESTKREKSMLVLALGNDLLGDDGVGLRAARALQAESPADVDIVETGEAGLALLEMLEGYRFALLLDAMKTGAHAPGTLFDLGPEQFERVLAPSPHYAGLPEVLALARRLSIDFPEEIRVLAVEVENPYEFSESLTPGVEAAMPEYLNCIRAVLAEWRSARPCMNTP